MKYLYIWEIESNIMPSHLVITETQKFQEAINMWLLIARSIIIDKPVLENDIKSIVLKVITQTSNV